MKTIAAQTLLVWLLLFALQRANAQGTFVNLDFENPILPLVTDGFGNVPITNALPGWIGYVDSTRVDSVRLNYASVGGPEISFHGPNSALQPAFHGNFSVFLESLTFVLPRVFVSIAQTGQIPASAKALLYYLNPA